MKKLFLMALSLGFVFSTVVSPKIQFVETEINFGEVESGKNVDVVFEFENAGNDLLVIKDISTSCGCTVAKMKKMEYKPGEKGKIPVQFRTRGRRGNVSQTVTLSTNDPDNGYIRLVIKGKVMLKDFALGKLQPDRLKFEGTSMNGETFMKVFTLKNTGNRPLRILEVTHNPEVYPIFPTNILKPGSEMKVEVYFKPVQPGRFFSILKIHTNSVKKRLVPLVIESDVAEGEEKP
jgi:hypothetical protein